MPRQGNTVESCVIVDWKVKEGDTVTEQTNICEVETDKASFEIPAGAAGKVLKILHEAGDDVPVLAPIAVIGEPGEDWQSVLPKEVSPKETVTAASQDSKEKTSSHSPAPKPEIKSEITVSPRARNLAEKEALHLNTLHGSGPEGRIIERDVLAALETRPALTAAAKAALAAKLPVGETVLTAGTGLGGRVTAGDIAAPARSHVQITSEGAITETPIKGIRKLISDRMLKSVTETAQFTLNASAPVTRLQDIRSRLKTCEYITDELKSLKITVNDLILFAVSRVLPNFSYMNSHKTGDIIKTFERVHLGFAVDTPRGLMVPVIRNANLLSLSAISSEAKRLAAACQNGSAKPEELSGSTFTVTNLGSLGITSFTPVLNIPEVAILGICAIEMKPAASGNGCSCEPHIGFSLTINHQAVDGAPAARFLKALCDTVADIDLLLALAAELPAHAG